MTLILLGSEDRRRRRKHSSPQQAPAPNPQSPPQMVVQNAPAASPLIPLDHQQYPQAVMQYAQSPSPYLPPPIVYGSPGYGTHSHPQHFPPQQSMYLNAGNSTIGFAGSLPTETSDDKPPSHVKRVKKMTAKSYSNLRDQLTSQAGKSVNQLTTKTSQYYDQSTHMMNQSTMLVTKKSTQALNQGAALCDRITSKFDAVITSIDQELFSGREQDLLVDENPELSSSPPALHPETTRSKPSNSTSRPVTKTKSSNHFSKVWLYANSRLPPHLPPFKVYMPTWPLLCLAASYAERVYTPPRRKHPEVETHIPSDWRSGAKAMVIKSVPIDDMDTVVFSIRGSATFMDWAVNYKSDPTSPTGFLDDPGNLCHAGFLHVARQMIDPVAERLRQLLEQAPSRSHSSLIITGHSAGGAVAALLYAHMLSTTVESSLTYLTGFFKRVHCITFGAPPTTLLPLQKPTDKRHKKSMFYSFINEGDPVPRADKQAVLSLFKLYASPAPTSVYSTTLSSLTKLNISSKSSSSTSSVTRPVWNMPPTTLSAAGRLIVLREKKVKSSSIGRGGHNGGVEAVTVTDEQLRTVVYGDPMKHMMTLYRERIEQLAVGAVTVKGY